MTTEFTKVDASIICESLEKSYIEGQYCHLEKLDIKHHAKSLFHCLCEESSNDIWKYLPDGPFDEYGKFVQWLDDLDEDFIKYVVIDKATSMTVGFVCYMDNVVEHRAVEIGWVTFSQAMQKTRIGTEVIYLLLDLAFAANYRRLVWRCNSLNQKSCAAALRFGFHPEGIFRQHMIVKGMNRDTAWFSITEEEWPALKLDFEQWLKPSNFNDKGLQRARLGTIPIE